MLEPAIVAGTARLVLLLNKTVSWNIWVDTLNNTFIKPYTFTIWTFLRDEGVLFSYTTITWTCKETLTLSFERSCEYHNI